MNTFQVILFTDLTSPVYHNKPLGAYTLATTLRQHGYSTLVIDHFSRYLRNPKMLVEILSQAIDNNTIMVAFSSTYFTLNLPEDQPIDNWHAFHDGQSDIWCGNENKVAVIEQFVRRKAPNAKLVYGGMLADNSELFKTKIKLDYVVKGYADVSMVALANHIKHGTPMNVRQQNNLNIVDTDTLAATFNFSQHLTCYEPCDIVLPGETLALETSRGCMYNCSFCNFPLRGRKRDSMDYHINNELLYRHFVDNYEKYGITNYQIVDDTFNETTEKLINFRNVVRRTGLPLQFMSFARLDLIGKHPEQLDILLEAGFRSLWFGLESLNDDSSRSISKMYTSSFAQKTLERMRPVVGNDFRIYASFIFGLPQDSEKTIEKWMSWVINDSPIDCIQTCALAINPTSTPWPADISVNAEQYGYTLHNNDGYVSWHNKIWTHKEAVTLADQYQNKIWETSRNRLAAFDLFGIMGHGYSFDSIKNIPIDKLPFDDIVAAGIVKFYQYHTALVNHLEC